MAAENSNVDAEISLDRCHNDPPPPTILGRKAVSI